MKYFSFLLFFITMFIMNNTTCMLRFAIYKKRIAPTRRIFSNHRNDAHDREYLIAQINALVKTVDSNLEIMQEQHNIINDLKKKLNILPEEYSHACPISNKMHTNLQCFDNSYIPEHNMHYGNKEHE